LCAAAAAAAVSFAILKVFRVDMMEVGASMSEEQGARGHAEPEQERVVGGQVVAAYRPEENAAEVEEKRAERRVGERLADLELAHVSTREQVPHVAHN
jgi:hypothetical protein